jgi:hypothetical protein
MVLIRKTDLMREALEMAKKETNDDVIDHKELYRISRSLEDPKYHYRHLLSKTGFYHPPKLKKPMTREYIEMMDRARNIVAEKEYREMTHGIDQSNDWDPKEWKMIKNQITAVFNVLFSIGAVFTAVFYIGELIHVDVGLRVLVSLLGALVVAVAEGWFLTKDLLHVEKQQG